MAIPAIYIGVVLLWSTTPLAIQWSSEGWGFLFGVSGRMVLGALMCAVLLQVLKPGLPWSREARHTYLAGATGIFGAMMSVYWASQFVPSSVVAVMFGLNPLVTTVMAAIWLQERCLTPGKLMGLAAAFLGLVLIFGSDFALQGDAWKGILALIVAVFIHSGSAVWVKGIGAHLPGLSVTSGSLFFAAPMYLLVWAIFDGTLPTEISAKAGISLLYLGVVASAIGFSMYFYLLRNVEANRVAMITLISPVLALMLGNMLNDERIPFDVWVGSACILGGMSFHLWGDMLLQRLIPVGAKQ
jgi:drug/metabolite transporter (DMT)-like permease